MAKAQKKSMKRYQDRLRERLGKGDHNPSPAERALWAKKGFTLPGSRQKVGT